MAECRHHRQCTTVHRLLHCRICCISVSVLVQKRGEDNFLGVPEGHGQRMRLLNYVIVGNMHPNTVC